MKKNKFIILILSILVIFITFGCDKDEKEPTENTKSIEKNKDTYIKYVQKLKDIEKSSSDIPFDINVTYSKLDDEEIRYEVTIDNPKQEIKDIKALAVHNKPTDDVFPSIGIFDNTIDLKTDSSSKGIVLVGYISYEGDIEDFECEMKVIITYKIDEKEVTNYYVTKK